MNQSSRIIPDLTAAARDFSTKLEQLLEPGSLAYLAQLHPDGVTPFDLASHHGFTWEDTCRLIDTAEAAGRLKSRRAADDGIRFVWRAGTVPPLTPIEAGLLHQARHDLADGPDEIWCLGASWDLQASEQAVRRALDFLVFAKLLTREGKTYALTDLGRTEGDPE